MQRLRFCNLESQCKSRFDPTASNEMHFITKFHNYHQPFSLNVLNESIQTESWLDERSNNWATLWVNGSTSFFLRNLHLSNFLLFWQLEKRKNFCRFKKKNDPRIDRSQVTPSPATQESQKSGWMKKQTLFLIQDFFCSGHIPLKVPNVEFDFDVCVHHMHWMHYCRKPNVK